MADEQIDLSAPVDQVSPKTDAVNAQFVRDLSHILIPETAEEDAATAKGPLITIGQYRLQFMEKAPVNALGHLIEGGLDGMRKYIDLSLEEFSKPDFAAVQDHVDIDGLGEILNALGEGYTSFPAQS